MAISRGYLLYCMPVFTFPNLSRAVWLLGCLSVSLCLFSVCLFDSPSVCLSVLSTLSLSLHLFYVDIYIRTYIYTYGYRYAYVHTHIHAHIQICFDFLYLHVIFTYSNAHTQIHILHTSKVSSAIFLSASISMSNSSAYQLPRVTYARYSLDLCL